MVSHQGREVKDTTSVSVNVECAAAPSEVKHSFLNCKYGDRLESLDANGDGRIDREELLAFIAEVVATEGRIKYLKAGLIAAVSLLLLFALTTFGTVWAVVVLSRDVQSLSATQGGNFTYPTFVDSASGETMRVSSGVVNADPPSENVYSDLQSVYKPANLSNFFDDSNYALNSTGGRRLQGASRGPAPMLVFIRDVKAREVIQACRILLDGRRSFVAHGSKAVDDGIDHVDVTITSSTGCEKAVKKNDVNGLQAKGSIAGHPVILLCEKNKCQLWSDVWSVSVTENLSNTLVIVSWVVKVLDATRKSVVSASTSRSTSAMCVDRVSCPRTPRTPSTSSMRRD